jgi:hypothetical protein
MRANVCQPDVAASKTEVQLRTMCCVVHPEVEKHVLGERMNGMWR